MQLTSEGYSSVKREGTHAREHKCKRGSMAHVRKGRKARCGHRRENGVIRARWDADPSRRGQAL